MPDFVVVGAAKAGTSTLRSALDRHPRVFLPDVDEPGWFAWTDQGAPRRWPTDVPADVPIRSQQAYDALYAAAPPGALTGEVCPLYLESAVAPQALQAACPGARIVVTLRDPVERAWSGYWMHVRAGLETRPPEAAFGPEEHRVEIGRYARNLRPWLDGFGPDAVLVLYVEEWARAGLGELASFLGLDSLDLPPPQNIGGRPRNRLVAAAMGSEGLRSAARRLPAAIKDPLRRGALGPSPALPPALGDRLRSLYAAEAVALEALVGRRPPWG